MLFFSTEIFTKKGVNILIGIFIMPFFLGFRESIKPRENYSLVSELIINGNL